MIRNSICWILVRLSNKSNISEILIPIFLRVLPPTLSWHAVECATEPYPCPFNRHAKKQHWLNFVSLHQQLKYFRDFNTYILKGSAANPFPAGSWITYWAIPFAILIDMIQNNIGWILVCLGNKSKILEIFIPIFWRVVPPILFQHAVEFATEPYPCHFHLHDKKLHWLNFGFSLQQVKNLRDFNPYILKGSAANPFLACSWMCYWAIPSSFPSAC